MNSCTQIVGGAIAYGISGIPNSKIATWRVFYIFIGAVTFVAGLIVFFLLPNSPAQARQFTDDEKRAAIMRVKDGQSGTFNKEIKTSQIWDAVLDVRVWLICLSVCLTSIPNGALTNFGAIIITSFGYSSRQALLLGIPSGVVGIIFVLIPGYLSDKLRDRSLIMMVMIIPTIIGAALLIAYAPNGKPLPNSKGVLLAAYYLTNTFGGAFMLLLTWNASNIAGHTKKVTANAMTLVAFCTGNMIGTQTFQAKDAPGYIPGKIAICVCLGIQIGISVVLRFMNDIYNKRKEKILAGMGAEERETERLRLAFADESDLKNPFFKYMH